MLTKEQIYALEIEGANRWQAMENAPTDGTNVLLAVKFGSFVYKIQGMYHDGKWHNAADREGQILCWMYSPSVPDHFLPWTEEYASRAASNAIGNIAHAEADRDAD